MANNPHLNPNTGHSACAAADAVCAKANGGKILLYAGTQPANAGAAATGSTLLATLSLSATAFAAAAPVGGNAQATANTITGAAAVASSNGSTPLWFRATESDGATGVFDGSAGTSAADMILPTTTVTAGVTVNVTSCTYTQAV